MTHPLLTASLLALAAAALPSQESAQESAQESNQVSTQRSTPESTQKAPTGRNLTTLIDGLYAVEAYKARSREKIDALLAPFAAVPAPSKSGRKTLLKKIEKAWGKLRELPKKGEHWYWDEKDSRRGRFFVTGKTSKPKGLFIGLHGGGVGSADAAGARGAYQGPAASRGWLSIFPQAIEATECGWTDTGTEEWIMTLIDEARRTYDVSPDHIYIGGHSMGGYGSWVLGAHHADLFAAAVPSAGAPTPIRDRGTERIVAIQEGVIPNLMNLPMCVFQSTDDPRVPPDVNQFAFKQLQGVKEQYGGYENFTYWEVDDRQHSYPTGGTDALLERIESFERNAHPDHLLWQPALDWRTSFYWLDWTKPRMNALIEATLNREANQIDIKGDGQSLEGLGVMLSPAIVDMEKEVTVTLDGEEVFRGVPEPTWATLVRTALVQDEGRLYECRIPLR
ncbi:MAG: poly(3-hydroxybutyrate) depolymerase [Planctomycetota bacterium]|jgi:poly(3-hydroxybutyrate) depolymerase